MKEASTSILSTYEVLKKWQEYTGYDENQKKFNLLSNDYDLHRSNKLLPQLQEFDSTGNLSVLYCKSVFLKLVSEKKINVIDLFNDNHMLDADMEMWNIFNSVEFTSLENRFLDGITAFLQKAKMQIGERSLKDERKKFLQSINSVAESLLKCNEDIYCGAQIGSIKNISSVISVFSCLSECLIQTEHAPDGLRLCYIAEGESAEGYFAYMLKSGDTILSLNDRVNETYYSAHSNSRNASWTESKKRKIFPYDSILNYSSYDYKGYATEYKVSDKQINIFGLSDNAYFPIIIAMVMIASKYQCQTIANPNYMYVSGLLGIEYLKPSLMDSKSLVHLEKDKSIIAQQHNTISQMLIANIETSDVLDINTSDKFNAKKSYLHHFYSHKNNLFVDLYGQGFVYDSAKPYTSKYTKLDSEENQLAQKNNFTHEFVGDVLQYEREVYSDARKQLTEYIRDRMYEEYLSFGGIDAVKDWWKTSLESRLSEIQALCAERYIEIEDGTAKNPSAGWKSTKERFLDRIQYAANVTYLSYEYGVQFYMNDKKYNDKTRTSLNPYICKVSGKSATHFFVFNLNDYKDMQKLLGCEVPKILKGWRCSGHRYSGNPLLSACDEVDSIGTPFEDNECRRNERYGIPNEMSGLGKHYGSCYSFTFAIGFSKLGLNKIVKDFKSKEHDKTNNQSMCQGKEQGNE